jgi:hypothetical protein
LQLEEAARHRLASPHRGPFSGYLRFT